MNLLAEYQVEYNKASDRKEYYYKLRDSYNNLISSAFSQLKENDSSNRIVVVERAAHLITLNKATFNGIYRMNHKGKFNAPWGHKKNLIIYNASNLQNVSKVLRISSKEVTIKACDYREMLFENIKGEGDFIYLDPPYDAESSTAYFTGYTSSEFSDNDQKEIAKVFERLDKRGCKVMMTNSNTPFIRELYTPLAKSIVEVKSKRSINCKGNKREGHIDLVIRNYCELSSHNGNSSSSNKKNKEEGGQQQQQLSLESFL